MAMESALHTCFHFGESPAGAIRCIEIPVGIHTSAEFLELVSRALEFPGYFGRNWDAFEECIRDLSWFPPGQVVLKHQDLPLAAEIPSLKTYLEVLCGAVRKWSASGERSLVVVFPAEFKDRVTTVIRLIESELDGR
jgi:hypothetical protein